MEGSEYSDWIVCCPSRKSRMILLASCAFYDIFDSLVPLVFDPQEHRPLIDEQGAGKKNNVVIIVVVN